MFYFITRVRDVSKLLIHKIVTHLFSQWMLKSLSQGSGGSPWWPQPRWADTSHNTHISSLFQSSGGKFVEKGVQKHENFCQFFQHQGDYGES